MLVSPASATRLHHPTARAYSQSKQKSQFPAGQDPKDTIFAKILAGTIPCKKAYEDDQILAFHDIAPQVTLAWLHCAEVAQAPVHVVVIPKKAIGGVEDFKQEDAPILGHLMVSIPKVAPS
jgi:diadenosine tetraphosphate (Ap4A) HIT family hydrolase